MKEATFFTGNTFTRDEANRVCAQFVNVRIEDDQGTHFRVVVRDLDGSLVWRTWNFEPDGTWYLNKYIASDGVKKQ
ncbi:DUF905 family protein [Salmonella enterica]